MFQSNRFTWSYRAVKFFTFYYTYCDAILARWQFQTVSTHPASATTASNMRSKWIYNISTVTLSNRHDDVGYCASYSELFAHLCIVNEISIFESCCPDVWMDVPFYDVLWRKRFMMCSRTVPCGEPCCAYLNDVLCLCCRESHFISVRKYSLVKVRRLR